MDTIKPVEASYWLMHSHQWLTDNIIGHMLSTPPGSSSNPSLATFDDVRESLRVVNLVYRLEF